LTEPTVLQWSRRTIAELLDTQAEQRGDQVFLYLDGQPVTYREMQSRSVHGAAALARLGVGPGDRVALMMATSPEWVATWFAVARLGAVAVPINTAYRGDFLAAPLLDSVSTVLAVDRSLLGRVVDVADQVPGLQWVLVRDDAPADDGRADVGPLDGKVRDIDTLWRPSTEPGPSTADASWDQPLAIFFTSGTTGRSKGALTSHQYLLAAAAAMLDCWQLQPGETVYAPLPLFHLSAVGSVLGPLLAGGTAVVDRVFSVSHTWERVREHGACGILLAGAMAVMLWNLPPDEADRHLPIRFFSAAPVPADLYRQIEQRYACKVVTVYGLSEAFPVTYTGVASPDNPPGASGRPNPRLEVVVVDEHDEIQPPGTAGEIVCRPREPHVMFEGYDGRPADTLAQLGNLWFHTGDLGRFDEAGNLTYVDRKKDAMRRRGENVSSFEVEQTILHHPAVAEAAAIGVPSDVGEDDIMACLILMPGAELDLVEFMDFCVERMPYFAVPRYVEVMEQLPKNVIGRVLKPDLRQRGVTTSTWDREQTGYVLRR
jgi:carnitine-CoA ligase